jgi:hypothetical protein
MKWLFSGGDIFANLKLHGNTKWLPESLVCLTLYWSWSECQCLTDAFTEALGYCRTISDNSPLGTYQGFMGAMVRWNSSLIVLMCEMLQERMQDIGSAFWQIGGWIPIGFDGSRSTAPRTKSNEEAFCASNYGKGITARYRKKKSKGMRRQKNERNKPQPQRPQAWITMMWHMGLRLPWMWRLGPSDSSERAHVMEMLGVGRFRKNTLFCGDAGFVGYPLWSAIIQQNTHFLVRVGANVSLLSNCVDYQLQKNGIVYCWPKKMRHPNNPPLKLRLAKVRLGKKTTAWLLTSVQDPSKLTPAQMIQFYKMRWGIELEFRGLKQTLDRATLRCRNHKRLLVELDWAIVGMAVAELFALKEQLSNREQQVKDQQAADPVKRSLANTMRAIRTCLRNLNAFPPHDESLEELLRMAVTDRYQRKTEKKARYRPPNPDKKPLGDPKLRKLTPEERLKIREHEEKLAA